MTHTPLILAATALMCCPIAAAADAAPEPLAAADATAQPKVGYSFDHYANNPKMQRTYISADMLRAANATKVFESSAWDISHVVSRLTGLLGLHTHSVSTTKQVRNDQRAIDKMKTYEKYIHSNWQTGVEIVVYCRHGRGHNIEELIIFKFRSNYCSRVIQLTGKLRPEDIASIIKQN